MYAFFVSRGLATFRVDLGSTTPAVSVGSEVPSVSVFAHLCRKRGASAARFRNVSFDDPYQPVHALARLPAETFRGFNPRRMGVEFG